MMHSLFSTSILCAQDEQCDAPAEGATSPYYCDGTSADVASSETSQCFTFDTTSWCKETPLSSGCPLLQPYTNGDCKRPENVNVQYRGGDPSLVRFSLPFVSFIGFCDRRTDEQWERAVQWGQSQPGAPERLRSSRGQGMQVGDSQSHRTLRGI